jgi:iron complex outermembrane receptor protein
LKKNKTTIAALGLGLFWLAGTVHAEPADLTELSLEELMKIEVTTVSKKSQKLSNAPAAVYVITQEDIRRSGVTSLPEALRLVPGIEVARIDSSKWAISSRGFNGRFANKLQVLIDGRSVYTPTFSGVYWEVQDLPLGDVERIEVIRGPGATLWGSNAVNGIVNVITKRAEDTQGGRLTLGGGTYEKRFGSLRYGARLGERIYGRAYVKGFARGDFDQMNGGPSQDDWEQYRGGFRVDGEADAGDRLTLQGDVYRGELDQKLVLPMTTPPYSNTAGQRANVSGANLLGRWIKPLGAASEFTVQAYYDHAYRNESFLTEQRDTFDLDAQYHFQPWESHDVVWGASYRWSRVDYSHHYPAFFDLSHPVRQLFGGYLQDEITLVPDTLKFTLGAKLEHNDFTGIEGQPNFRLLWKPNEQHRVWGAISRAVRIPSFAEDSATLVGFVAAPGTRLNPTPLPAEVVGLGGGGFRAEVLWAYELGYRFMPRADFSVDAALFYNGYQHLRSQEAQPPVLVGGSSGLAIQMPNRFGNTLLGETYGAEIAVDWRPLDHWQLQLNYSYLRAQLGFAPGSADNFSADPTQGAAPRQRASLRSSLTPVREVDFDLWLRYVDALPSTGFPADMMAVRIPAYVTLDARLAWRPLNGLELSLVGQNLLDPRHPEYGQELYPPVLSQVPRSVYGKIEWHF